MRHFTKKHKFKIALVGLGYVGLPLVLKLGSHFKTLGYDFNKKRVETLSLGEDYTSEVSSAELADSKVKFTSTEDDLKGANIFIICVPTPINENKIPDLTKLKSATETVAKYIKPEAIIIFESTVYPGASEDFCVPILEKVSGLKFNDHFSIGYSPERINPGDKDRTIENIVKVVSASNEDALDKIQYLYSKIIKAGIHVAPSIKVAEFAKVIENIQRDVNIALINELTLICDAMEIKIYDVLSAANTKWNFLNFRPGLVGGHCIGVDPYYLLHKAKSLGITPELITAGRRLNEEIVEKTAIKIVKASLEINERHKPKKGILLGVTFKPNCSDTRNSKYLKLVDHLREWGIKMKIYDPIAALDSNNKNLSLIKEPKESDYNIVILAVPHDYFMSKELDFYRKLGSPDGYIFVDLHDKFKAHDAITF